MGKRSDAEMLLEELESLVAERYPEKREVITRRALSINKQLCEENPNQPDEVRRHTVGRIYPAIAFYKALLEELGDQSAAYELVADNFNGNAKKQAKILRGICKIPFLYRLVPKVMASIIHNVFGEKSGFRMENRVNEKEKCHIDMMFCPYYSNCVKYGCPELGTVFCNTDDISYGNMHPKLYWGRTKTLARGDECCDFILEIKTDIPQHL